MRNTRELTGCGRRGCEPPRISSAERPRSARDCPMTGTQRRTTAKEYTGAGMPSPRGETLGNPGVSALSHDPRKTDGSLRKVAPAEDGTPFRGRAHCQFQCGRTDGTLDSRGPETLQAQYAGQHRLCDRRVARSAGIKVNTDTMARTTQLVQQGFVKITK